MSPSKPGITSEPPVGLAKRARMGEVEDEGPPLAEEGLPSIPVSYFMKTVVSVDEEDSVREAARIMAEKDIGSIIICDANGAYVGIVTERDIVWNVATGRDAKKITVKDIMSSPVITINERTPIAEAIKVMVKEKVRRLPVTRGNRIVGIVTQTDIQRAILDVLRIIGRS